MALPVWARDKRVWAFGGAGAGLGLLVYLKRRQNAQNNQDVTGQTIQPTSIDSAGVDAYNQLQSGLEQLQGEIEALQGGAPLPSPQQAVSPTHHGTQLHRASRGAELHRIGRLGGTYNLRAVAAKYARNPTSPASVESELRRIVQANPSLRGKTTVKGGFPLRVPRP